MAAESSTNPWTAAASVVREAELETIRKRPGREPRPGEGGEEALVGLALSGGGVRSASFALGVMHALVRGEKLRHVDYLSTVSGGGYAGSALTWALSTFEGAGVGVDDFPLGGPRRGAVGTAEDPGSEEDAPPEADGATGSKGPVRALDWIRRRGKYLTPKPGLDVLSLVGVVLRCATISVFVVLSLFVSFQVVSLVLGKRAEAWIGGLPVPASLQGAAKGYFEVGLWAVLVLSAVFLLGSLAYALTTRWRPRKGGTYGLRWWSQVVLGHVLRLQIATLFFLSLPWVQVKLAGATWATAGAFVTTGWGGALLRLALARRARGDERGGLSSVVTVVSAAALAYGVLLLSFQAGLGLEEQFGSGSLLAAALLVVASLGVGLATNSNYTSPHRMYRDRLMEAFLPTEELVRNGRHHVSGRVERSQMRAPDHCGLEEVGLRRAVEKAAPESEAAYPGPYPLINTNLVTTASPDPSLRDRGGESFLLSPLFCGSAVTGWRRTNAYRLGSGDQASSIMTLASAMAISGAAANPHAGVGGRGVTRGPAVSFLMELLNVRLGYLEINPDPRRRKAWLPKRPNHVTPALARLFGLGAREDGHFIELSDGGHFENLAVYELLRREVDVILCSDGGADPDFRFGDLANLIERARVDFGVNIDFVDGFEHERLAVRRPDRPDDTRPAVATPGFALARIAYPPCSPGGKGKRGILIYLKATMIAGLPADLTAFRSANPDFPHQSTMDQFFDEAQFEAYRELGYRLGRNMARHPRVTRLLGGDPEKNGGRSRPDLGRNVIEQVLDPSSEPELELEPPAPQENRPTTRRKEPAKG